MTQNQALDILKLGYNVYLTGSAGSGKTYLLNKYIGYLKNHGVAVGVTASTGIASTHLSGVTIHSWSGIGIEDNLSKKDLNDLTKKHYLKKRFKQVEVLVIDEISMLHARQLDLVDKVCRRFKNDTRPFGGLQIVLCGDFFQLPPVGQNTAFAMEADVWQQMDLKICYLHEQHRQADPRLTHILNDIRTNQVGEKTLGYLKERCPLSSASSDDFITKLFTHNFDVDALNHHTLSKISNKTCLYRMKWAGKNKLAKVLQRGCLAPEELFLKKDAVVMFVKNNFDAGYVNGTLGKVVDFDENRFPIVETFYEKRLIVAAPMSWIIEEDGGVLAEIIQVPLRLAWAITVHKSQGMSLDAVEIDLSKSFEKGMGYVAISRARSLDGIRLMGFNQTALQVNEDILDFDEDLKLQSQEVVDELLKLDKLDKMKKQEDFLSSIKPIGSEKKKSKKVPGATYIETYGLAQKKLTIKEMARRRGLTERTIIGHLEKLAGQGKKNDLTYYKPPKERLDKIKKAFDEVGELKLSLVKDALGKKFSYEEIQLARIFLN